MPERIKFRLRFHRHRLRIRRQRHRPAPHRKGLSRRRHGNGPPLDARKSSRTPAGPCTAGSGVLALRLRGFFNMRFFRHVTILHGCAVGGGSITYASTLLRAPDKVWQSGSWAGLAPWKAEMPRHYDTASACSASPRTASSDRRTTF